MTYNEFKTLIATFLWKETDAELVANLDSLIRVAEAELNSTLTISRRDRVDMLTISSVPSTGLPLDYMYAKSLLRTDNVQYSKTSTQQVLMANARNDVNANLFSIEATNLGYAIYATGITVPRDFIFEYGARIPSFQEDEGNWLATDYLDLFMYTVLSHTAPFLREDERVPMWLNAKMTALNAVVRLDKSFVAFGGTPFSMPSPRTPPRSSR